MFIAPHIGITDSFIKTEQKGPAGQEGVPIASRLRADVEEWSIRDMEAVKIDGASNGVGSHVWEHNPVPVSEEGQGVLSHNSVQTIARWPKQSGPAVSKSQLRLYSFNFCQSSRSVGIAVSLLLAIAVVQYRSSC